MQWLTARIVHTHKKAVDSSFWDKKEAELDAILSRPVRSFAAIAQGLEDLGDFWGALSKNTQLPSEPTMWITQTVGKTTSIAWTWSVTAIKFKGGQETHPYNVTSMLKVLEQLYFNTALRGWTVADTYHKSMGVNDKLWAAVRELVALGTGDPSIDALSKAFDHLPYDTQFFLQAFQKVEDWRHYDLKKLFEKIKLEGSSEDAGTGPFSQMLEKDGIALFMELDQHTSWSESIFMDVSEGMYGGGAIPKNEIPRALAQGIAKRAREMLAAHRKLSGAKQWEALKKYKSQGVRGSTPALKKLISQA